MTPALMIHVASGLVAIIAGTLSLASRKGGTIHRRAGAIFAGAMLLLGASAAVLDWTKPVPEPGLGGLLAGYFAATAWMTVRFDGRKARVFAALSGLFAVVLGGFSLLAALTAQTALTPAGNGPAIAFGGLAVFAGLADLRLALLGVQAGRARLRRHLWRMLFSFFIATGSFFLGQQDVLPEALRGTIFLFVLAFAPLAFLVIWSVRVRWLPLNPIVGSPETGKA